MTSRVHDLLEQVKYGFTKTSNAQNNSFVRAEWAKGSQGGGGDQVCRGGCGGKSDGSVFARTTGFCKT